MKLFCSVILIGKTGELEESSGSLSLQTTRS